MSEQLEKLISELYEGVENKELFSETLSKIVAYLGAAQSHLFLLGEDNSSIGLNFTANMDPNFLNEYHQNYVNIDYRLKLIMGSPVGAVLTDDQFNTADGLRSSPIHNDLFPRYGVNRIMGSNITVDGQFGWFGVTSQRKDGTFSKDVMEDFSRFVVHARKALQLRQLSKETGERELVHRSSNDAQTHAVIMLANGEIEYVNKIARDILDLGFVRIQNGRLVCRNPSEQKKLEAVHRRVRHGEAPLVRLLDDKTNATYAVQVFNPLPRFVDGRLEPARWVTYKIVLLNPQDSLSSRTLDRVSQFYGLSVSESAAIAAVIAMQPLADFSRRKGVQEDTVRKQLKSAMTKMAVNSQKQLFQVYERFKVFE
ncbi:helix-turn-helix transcriptional regulator [Roseibium sp. LAB1]